MKQVFGLANEHLTHRAVSFILTLDLERRKKVDPRVPHTVTVTSHLPNVTQTLHLPI